MFRDFLLSPYTIAFGLPFALMLLGSIAKKLIRGTNWALTDFFLGIELALAAMTSGLLYLFELLKRDSARPALNRLCEMATACDSTEVARIRQLPEVIPLVSGESEGILLAVSFVTVSVFALFSLLATHQQLESSASRYKKVFWLCLVSNGVGMALLAGFVFIVKGIR